MKPEVTRAMQVVSDVEKRTGFLFSIEDIIDTARLTIRKCELNHKDDEYFYILLGNELEDVIRRHTINEMGKINLERRKKECAVCAG